MNDKIAIDVVLLLPGHVNEVCAELNRHSNTTSYVSFDDGYYPHISLGMGSLFTEDLERFKTEIEACIRQHTLPMISISSIGHDKYTYLDVVQGRQLKIFHAAIFDLITKHTAGAVSKEHFFELESPGSIIDWVNHYKDDSAYEKYKPHVTLGKEVQSTHIAFPIRFKPTLVGLFQLGRHGTCKNLLHEIVVGHAF